jgi:hypothetical protein
VPHTIEYMFYTGPMADNPADRIIIARLTGTARRHARHRALTDGEHQAAVSELAAIAQDRADLLAEAAGITAGAHAGDPDEPHHLRAAQLCIDAGADRSQVTRWTQEGQRRAAAARASRTPR